MRLKTLLERFKQELAVWRAVWRDPRTPRGARLLLGLALAYAVMPFDIIPDFIPVLGQLDDVIIIPMLIWLAVKFTPTVVIAEARQLVASNLKSPAEIQ